MKEQKCNSDHAGTRHHTELEAEPPVPVSSHLSLIASITIRASKAEEHLLLGVFVLQKMGGRNACSCAVLRKCLHGMAPFGHSSIGPRWAMCTMHSSYAACYFSFLLCVFECDKEKPKITHIGRNVSMETRRQFSTVWPLLTQKLQ